MNIDIKDLITLDDKNEYVVVGKVDYDGITYYYIVDINNNSNFKFCYLDHDEFVESSNQVLNTMLLPLFMKSLNDIF